MYTPRRKRSKHAFLTDSIVLLRDNHFILHPSILYELLACYAICKHNILVINTNEDVTFYAIWQHIMLVNSIVC